MFEHTSAYVQEYTNFRVNCLNEELHKQTCGYWYTITSRGGAHTAFREAADLLQWIQERGLQLIDELPAERGTYKTLRIEGTYKTALYMDIYEFKAIKQLLKIAVMDNAQLTLGKVTEDENKVRTVHYLNVNVERRVVFPRFHIEQRRPGWEQIVEESFDTN